MSLAQIRVYIYIYIDHNLWADKRIPSFAILLDVDDAIYTKRRNELYKEYFV